MTDFFEYGEKWRKLYSYIDCGICKEMHTVEFSYPIKGTGKGFLRQIKNDARKMTLDDFIKKHPKSPIPIFKKIEISKTDPRETRKLKMKSEKIKTFKNGEPYVFKEGMVKNHICCDCGLVHFIYTERTNSGGLVTYWYRDDYETERLKKVKK